MNLSGFRGQRIIEINKFRFVKAPVGKKTRNINLQVHACNNGERQSKMMENEPMNAEEKKRDLYLRQKELLDTFLEHGAISRAQYDKSLGDLTEKMGMEPKV